MRIFIAGATGVVGRRAVRLLRSAGHEVVGHGSDLDLFDPSAVGRAAAGYDVVINLATAIPSGARMALRSAWETTARLRTEGSRNLADVAADGGARFIQESAVTVYDDGGDTWLDESAPTRNGPILGPPLRAEQHAAMVNGVALRFGLFYGPDAAHTQDEVALARRGFAATVGDADGYQPDLHLDDAASAVVAAIEAPPGTYNVTGDEPVTRGERTTVLAAVVGRERLRTPPDLAGRLGTARILARSRRVSNTRFRDATGWAPAHPSIREGLPPVVREILAQYS